MNNGYTPLPKETRIGPSALHGMGIFATTILREGFDLGLTHIRLETGLFRTPLGGFLNHSDEANCVLVNDRGYFHLLTNRRIEEGEELTLNYTKEECGKQQNAEPMPPS